MKKKCLFWLRSELPVLVSAGVLSQDGADRLRDHYGLSESEEQRNIGLVICALLGASLVGLGVILLFAHNWENLSRPIRTVLAFTPLVMGQVLTSWTLVHRSDSVPWREGSTVFLMAGIGSAIALIGQTYHIPGDLGAFLLTWMLLSIPLVYLVNASAPAAFYWIGITSWTGYVQDEGGHALLFYPLAALLLPHLWMAIKEDRYGHRAVLLKWVFSLGLCVATGLVLEKSMPGIWVVVYSGLFATLYLLGKKFFQTAPTLWQQPLQIVGGMGVVVLSLLLTLDGPWMDVGWRHFRQGASYHEWAAVVDYLLAVALVSATGVLLAWFFREKRYDTFPIGLAGFFGFVGYVLVSLGAPEEVGMGLFNLYLFAVGSITLAVGIGRSNLTTTNAGLLMLATLIVARFFDWNLSFTVRGIAFIAIGIGFLAVNFLVRRKEAVR